MEQPTPAQPPAIEVHGLRKTFATRAVLDGIDLTVRRGQVFGYVGPNGAGKSTTVRILAGLLAPFDGEVRLAAFDVRAEPLEIKRRIGDVPGYYEGRIDAVNWRPRSTPDRWPRRMPRRTINPHISPG